MVISGKNLTMNFIGCVFFVQLYLKGHSIKQSHTKPTPNNRTTTEHKAMQSHHLDAIFYFRRVFIVRNLVFLITASRKQLNLLGF